MPPWSHSVMSVVKIHLIYSSNPCKSQHLRAAELPLRQNYAHAGIEEVQERGWGGSECTALRVSPILSNACHASLQTSSHVLLSWFNLAPFGNVKTAKNERWGWAGVGVGSHSFWADQMQRL